MLLVSMMAVSLIGCGGSSEDATADEGGDDGGLIKVGIINNDPNESGYRTANDKDMKETFTEENGYDASFAYSLKNDEQIASAQNLSRTVLTICFCLQQTPPAGIPFFRMHRMREHRLSCLTVPSMQMKASMQHLSFPTWKKKVRLL